MSVTGEHSCASCHRQELALHRRQRARGRRDGGDASARKHESRERRVQSGARRGRIRRSVRSRSRRSSRCWGSIRSSWDSKGQEERFLKDLLRDTLYQRLFPRAFPEHERSRTRMTQRRSRDRRVRADDHLDAITVRSLSVRRRPRTRSRSRRSAARRFFFSGQRGSCFPVSRRMELQRRRSLRGPRRRRVRRSSTRDSTTSRRASRIRCRIRARISSPDARRTSESSVRRRCATSRSPRRTCTTAASRRWATCSTTTRRVVARSTSGAYAGVGHDNRNKSPNVHGFAMTASDKPDLIAFLESLTDTAFLRNPALSNPWK